MCADESQRPKGLWERLAHAFALNPEGDLAAEDYAMLDSIARQVVRRRLTAPVILALQSVKPLGFLGSQAMVALKPFAELIIPVERYDRFAQIMERREGVELLITRIERAEVGTDTETTTQTEIEVKPARRQRDSGGDD